MAANKKKTIAQKTVSDKKKQSAAKGKSGSGRGSKNVVSKPEQKTKIPANLVLALICIVLLIAYIAIILKADGWMLAAIHRFTLGLIGEIGFYIATPCLVYMIVILLFRTRTNVYFRSFCMTMFILICGTSGQISAPEQTYASLWNGIVGLYQGGIDGSTAGLICGSFGMFLTGAVDHFIAYLILAICGFLAILGSMQITIPSIIRAIQNRPRADFDMEDDEEEYEEYEPAALVVNHFANKQIENKRKKLEQRQNAQMSFPLDEPESQPRQLDGPRYQENPVKTSQSQVNSKDFMSHVEEDVSTPVPAAETKAEEKPKKVRKVKPIVVEPEAEEPEPIPTSMPEYNPEEIIPDAPKTEQKKDKVTHQEAEDSARQVAAEIESSKAAVKPAYCFPPVNLLKLPASAGISGTEEMKENSRRLNETLESFRIDARIINVTRGPSVTRYEVELDKGVRLSKLTSCADDIALSLGASGVRIAAVPGKISIVGIEVPNRVVTTVPLREVIDSNEFHNSKGKSTFAVGKDIGGSCIVGNIAKMPHMLIAGTTGSGKSVCMNSLIISILYKAGPEDVKLIMVDPKMVELASYNGIPHLMIPVVTDPKKAAGALQWAVTEMMRRYKSMSDLGVRDLESYNSIIAAEGGDKIPQLVVIIDELADLMLVAAKEVEDSICRIAQMGRASGIHLVIATQRPSADVITGLMKANIPSRIAFSVASAMESRIILDTPGAEKLVGKGDMLFAPIGCGKPLRVQGCFVSDEEVEAVTSYVKSNFIADYDQTVLDDIEKKAQQTGKKPAAGGYDPEPNADELDGDEMLPAAVEVVLESGLASVSMLQRRLKLGYARAARIVDEMEEKGIVGPFQGAKGREVLITREQWASMQSGGQQMSMTDMDTFDGVPEDF